MGEIGKIPPHDNDIEEVILGAMLMDKNAVSDVIDIIQPNMFYSPKHMIIFKAMHDLFKQNDPIDMVTVMALLRKGGRSADAGGASAIARLTQRVNTGDNIHSHIKILQEKSMQRDLITLGSKILNQCFEGMRDVFEIIGDTDKKLNSIVELNTKGSVINFQSGILDTYENIIDSKGKNLKGIPSGFTDLDDITGGWQKTDLIVIAARPGMGKTAFVVSSIVNVAKTFKKPVAMFSLEMSFEQLAERIISSESCVNLNKIKRGDLNGMESERIHDASMRVSTYPIYIDDTGGLTILELRAKARRMKRNFKIELLVIDYLQLMSGDGKSNGNREQEISMISRSLKALAKELEIPIIALSQLSRAVEARGGTKKPQLSDLRESGAIEQDADMVGFLYRPEYYKIYTDEDGTNLNGKGMVIIEKHRNGSLGEVFLRFIGAQTRWENDSKFTANSSQFPSMSNPIKHANQYQNTESKNSHGAPF